MLFTFENKSSAHALGGVSVVVFFIATDEQLQYSRGCYFPMQAMLPDGFPFHQLIINYDNLNTISNCK